VYPDLLGVGANRKALVPREIPRYFWLSQGRCCLTGIDSGQVLDDSRFGLHIAQPNAMREGK